MSYIITIAAISLVIILVNALLMQEQSQATSTVADGITNHISIDNFDAWCETHEPSGYWPVITDTCQGTFIPTGTPGESRFVTWEDCLKSSVCLEVPASEEVTADPETWKYLSPTAEEEGAGPIEWVDKQGCHNWIRGEHWLIWTAPVGEGQIWIGAAYQEDAMYGKDWLAPDWSCGSDWHDNIAEAAVVCLHRVWCNNGIERAEELTHVLIEMGMIPETVKMESTIAIIDGEWYFASCDPDNMGRSGIRRSNEVSEYHPVSEFSFSADGHEVADQIVEAAVEEAEEFNSGYDAWEASWIDGPQSW